MRHSERCAVFRDPPTLRDPSDCDCNPALPSSRLRRVPGSPGLFRDDAGNEWVGAGRLNELHDELEDAGEKVERLAITLFETMPESGRTRIVTWRYLEREMGEEWVRRRADERRRAAEEIRRGYGFDPDTRPSPPDSEEVADTTPGAASFWD